MKLMAVMYIMPSEFRTIIHLKTWPSFGSSPALPLSAQPTVRDGVASAIIKFLYSTFYNRDALDMYVVELHIHKSSTGSNGCI